MDCSLLFRDYALIWYDDVIAKANLSEGTKRNYRIIIYDHLIPFFKRKELTAITSMDCQQLMERYNDCSWSQGNKVRLTMKRIFNYAIENHLANINPAEDVKLPKTKSSENLFRKMTEDEVELMYRTYKNTGVGLMFILMYETGMRPIEVMNQQWRNIDLNEGIIQLSFPKNKNRKELEIQVSDYLLGELRSYKRYKRYVFNKATDDKQHNEQSLKFAWRKFRRLMDIENGARVRNGQVMQTTIAYDLSPILISRQTTKAAN